MPWQRCPAEEKLLPGFCRTDPAVLAKRGGTYRRVRKPTGCFLSFWLTLSQPGCSESGPEETDQKTNKKEPLPHACYFPLLPAMSGQISATKPSWGRTAAHGSQGFQGVFERLELSQCLLLCWRSPSGFVLMLLPSESAALGLLGLIPQLTWLCLGTTSGSGGVVGPFHRIQS